MGGGGRERGGRVCGGGGGRGRVRERGWEGGGEKGWWVGGGR